MITFYGFSRVIAPVVGSTRDLRALWALEETGLPYRVYGLDFVKGDLKSDDYRRLSPFQRELTGRPYLAGESFTVADILMTTVLRGAHHAALLEQYPSIRSYASRCQQRPAWTRTLADYERRLGVAPGTAA